MRPFASSLFAALALAVAAPGLAWADTPPAGAPVAGTPAPDATPPAKPKAKGWDPNQVICKRTETTGSHLGGEETCLTRGQWDDIATEARRRFDDARDRSSPPRGPGLGS
jgi:hypothetical protein